MPSPHNPDHLVRTQQRRRRHTTLVWALAFAVLAAALAFAEHLAWLPPTLVIGHWSLIISSALALTIWLIRARRIDAGAVARDLDSQWSLQARLEAAAELSGNPSAFAAAQRADAAAKLAGHRVPRALAWHAGQFVLIVALLLFLTESGIFGFRILFKPPAPPPPPADISASIEWRSPASELKATAIEEIPLVAAADSHTGFRAMSLEISINGEPRLSRPLDTATLAALAKPGPHPVKLPLYLDETGAVEFDMVSYHLRADRIPPQVSGLKSPPSPLPAITSPLQFIQIRPAREDVRIIKPPPGGGGKIGELAAIIGALKAAQLSLLKQNFLLAHAQIPKTDKAWTEANTTVATDQKTLAAKTGEARAFAIAAELDTLIVDILTQVIPIMEEASKLITSTQNEPAARPQGKALGLITEIEKLIQKVLLDPDAKSAGGKPPPPNPDPFKDDQRYKLPPRKDTAAGQLEQLAQDQTEQAKKTEPTSPTPNVAGSASDPTPKPPSAEDQAELARRAAELAKNQQLSDAAQKAAAQAARDAAAAANQLKQGDVSAARAPAQAAAQTLRDAAAAQEKAGRDAARAQLEAARRALDAAAREPDAAARAAKLDAIAAELQAAARAQQESGSAEAARQLQAAARETAKAAEAARKGTDAPGDQSGNEPGDKPGNVNPGTEPGKTPGDQPEDTPSAKPGDQPGQTAAADPNGDLQMTVSLPGAGKEPGNEPGSGQGKEPGQNSSQKPDKDGTGQGQGEGKGEGPGKEPGDKPGSDKGSGQGEGQGEGSGPGSGSGSIPRLVPTDRAGQTAANAQAALSDRTETINRAVRQLERGSGAGSGSTVAGSASDPTRSPVPNARATDLVLGAQLAQAVLATSEAAKLANTIVNRLRREPSGAANVVMPADLRGAADRLRLLLAAALNDDRRDETVRRFNPEDIDPAYREAVEAYFERLSREARKP
ncbi:MAG: hypothetical protein WC661_16555 [Opitutaceae bacterium]|jgi:hypothetical protein